MGRRLGNALDECLVLLVEGDATLDECVARYPEHALELRRLLSLAVTLRQMPSPAPRADAAAEGKRRMLEALAEKQRGCSVSPVQRLQEWARSMLTGAGRPTVPALRVAAAAAVLVLLVTGGALVSSRLGGAVSRAGMLEAASGPVARATEGGEWVSVAVGQRLMPGDSLRTDEGVTATVRFFDGSWSEMQGGAELALEEMSASRWGGRQVILLEQKRGEVYHQVHHLRSSGSTFTVRTPTGVAQVRGTGFLVSVTDDGATEISVREGSVSVSSGNVSVEVLPGWATRIEPQGEPVVPFEVAEEVFDGVGMDVGSLDALKEAERASRSPEPTASETSGLTMTSSATVRAQSEDDSPGEAPPVEPTGVALTATSTQAGEGRRTATPPPTPTDAEADTPGPLPTEPPTSTPTEGEAETPPPLPTEPPTATPTPDETAEETPPPLPTEPPTPTP